MNENDTGASRIDASQDQVITTRAEFHAALVDALAAAATAGSRELWLVDTDFTDWPLGEIAVIEQLDRWVSSRRRLTLIAHNFDAMAARHPRWVTWRRPWAHVVHCRSNAELEADDYPSLLLAHETASVRLSDKLHYRGRASRTVVEGLRCQEMVDAVSQRSEEAFPVNTTGL